MSSPSVSRDGPSPPGPVPDGVAGRAEALVAAARHRLPQLARSGAYVVTRPARAVAFWSAIALPFLHLGLLWDGLATTSETTTFLVLLAANLVALYIGHGHGQGE